MMKFAKRLALLLVMLLVTSLYFPLNRYLTNGYNLKTALDAYVPLVPAFAVPYLLFLPFWIVAYLLAAWKMNDRLFRAFMFGSISATAIATLTYLFFPTYTARPEIAANGWDASLLKLIYGNDAVFNAFPSGHVLFTTLIALFGATWHSKWSLWLNGSVLLVILATLLTGQHHLVDPLGGLALGWGGYRFGLWAEYGLDGMYIGCSTRTPVHRKQEIDDTRLVPD
jgi:membrane-associated phospholipid phosphatase